MSSRQLSRSLSLTLPNLALFVLHLWVIFSGPPEDVELVLQTPTFAKSLSQNKNKQAWMDLQRTPVLILLLIHAHNVSQTSHVYMLLVRMTEFQILSDGFFSELFLES